MDQQTHVPFGKIQSPREPRDAPRSIERVRHADSPARQDELQESIEDALRWAARATLSVGVHGEPDERSRKALNVVCDLARRDELHVEQLLVHLKDTWRHLPEVQSVGRMDADVTLACVITHCIKEFYRPVSRS